MNTVNILNYNVLLCSFGIVVEDCNYHYTICSFHSNCFNIQVTLRFLKKYLKICNSLNIIFQICLKIIPIKILIIIRIKINFIVYNILNISIQICKSIKGKN